MRITTLAVLLVLACPARGTAQSLATPYAEAIRASAALQLAARRAHASEVAVPVVPADVVAPRRGKRAEGVTLMIIGGAAVVVGAIAGGTGGAVLIVGGVVCAGYGFYLYSE